MYLFRGCKPNDCEKVYIDNVSELKTFEDIEIGDVIEGDEEDYQVIGKALNDDGTYDIVVV
jgi:hypothetical protein